MNAVNLAIRDLPKEERPYEKCVRFGPSSLSDRELLGVIIRSGKKGHSSMDIARDLLEYKAGGLIGLNDFTYEELVTFKGIGHVKAIELICLVELSKRMTKRKREERLDFSCASTIADYYMEDMRYLDKEQLLCVFLDNRLRRIGEQVISVGTVNLSLLPAREIFIAALKQNAVCIVLIHNHPSGDPTPGMTDVTSTKKILGLGNQLGIRLIDHIVIGDNCYVSMRERELIS